MTSKGESERLVRVISTMDRNMSMRDEKCPELRVQGKIVELLID